MENEIHKALNKYTQEVVEENTLTMKIEIKFRAWDKIKKDWLFKGYSLSDIASSITSDELATCDIVESTNLKDKNGVEIYEGDILKEVENSLTEFRNVLDFVVYDIDRAMFRLSNHDNTYLGAEDSELYLEVIGNIYENKELL